MSGALPSGKNLCTNSLEAKGSALYTHAETDRAGLLGSWPNRQVDSLVSQLVLLRIARHVDHVVDGVDHQLRVPELDVVVAVGIGDVHGTGELRSHRVLRGQLRRPQRIGERLVD